MPPYPSGRGPGSVSVAGRQIKSYLSYRRSMPLRDRPHEDPCEVSAPAKSTTAVPAALQAGGRDCDCAVPSSYLSVSDTDSVESRPRLGAGPARSLYTAVTGRTVCLYLSPPGAARRQSPASRHTPNGSGRSWGIQTGGHKCRVRAGPRFARMSRSCIRAQALI